MFFLTLAVAPLELSCVELFCGVDMKLIFLLVALMAVTACDADSESECENSCEDFELNRQSDAMQVVADIGVTQDAQAELLPGRADIDPPLFGFDFVAEGEMGLTVVRIRNGGEATLNLGDFAPAFGDAYTLYWTLEQGDTPLNQQEPGVINGRNMMPSQIELEAGEVLTLSLAFLASGDAVRGGQLVFEADRQIRIPIEHSDDRPEFLLEETSIDLGDVPVGERRLGIVSVTNVGTAVATLASVTFDGDEAFSLRIEGRDPEVDSRALHNPDRDLEQGVSIDKSFEIIVRFLADSAGVVTGNITIASDAINSEIIVPVRANAVQP